MDSPPRGDKLVLIFATWVASGTMGCFYVRGGTHLWRVLLLVLWVVCTSSGFGPMHLGGEYGASLEDNGGSDSDSASKVPDASVCILFEDSFKSSDPEAPAAFVPGMFCWK